MIQYIIIITLMSLLACGDNSPTFEMPPLVEENIFELQWATRVNMTKEIVSTDNTQQFGDWVLVGGDIGDPPTIVAFNKVTGEKAWKYIHEGIVNNKILLSSVSNNLYIGISNDGIIALNLVDQSLLWELSFISNDYSIGGRFFIIYDTDIYINVSKGGVGLDSRSAIVLKVDLNTGDFQEEFESTNDAQGLKSISPVALSEINGELNMFFNEKTNAELPPQNVYQQLVAYNLNSKEIIWTSEVTDKFASNSLHPPIIYNDIIITGGDWNMYAFDVHTGEQLWRTEISVDSPFSIFTKTNHLIYEDRLYVNENGENVTCLDPMTGEIIWNNPVGGPNCTDNMLYYKKEDYLVFTSWGYGSVMILDALTGETVHREHRYDESQYNNDIVYDEALDMFFTSTYKHAMGFKINATE